MLLVVLLLVVSVGVNVLLGFKAVKLSNKVDSAEIVADEYKNKADYWRKQYEANRNVNLEDTQKSHDVLAEAFEELGEWYNQVQKDLENAQEDYEVLAEQNDFLNTEYEDALNRADRYREVANETLEVYRDLLEGLLEMSLHNREAYELLISIEKLYVTERWVADKKDTELVVSESGREYYKAKDNATVYHLDQDLIGEKDCYFYFDYIYDIAEPILVEY